MTVIVNLSQNSSISLALANFEIHIVGCIITEFTMINLSPEYNQTYIISDPTLTWSLVGNSITKQVPPCSYN